MKSRSKKKSGIHIKSSHKGLLHKELGIKPSKKIPEAALLSKMSMASPKEKKQITFALNARKWSHAS